MALDNSNSDFSSAFHVVKLKQFDSWKKFSSGTVPGMTKGLVVKSVLPESCRFNRKIYPAHLTTRAWRNIPVSTCPRLEKHPTLRLSSDGGLK